MRPVTTSLSPWFPDAAALAAGRRRLSRSVLFPARDRAWQQLTPRFDDVVALTAAGLPFQIAAERRYDRSGRAARLRPALAAGKTVFLPQIHQVLPRVMRLMVALRMAFMGPGREECSFLFLVEGRGREGLGLHHDDDVHAFWLQLEGRRTVTLGPPVTRGTPQDLPNAPDRRDGIARGGFVTRALPPGSLLYLPPRTPHRVVCYERSLALSLTWSVRRRARSGRRTSHAAALTEWDVASGRVPDPPPSSRTRVWTQIPVAAVGAGDLALPDGGRVTMPHSVRRFTSTLALMGSFTREVLGDALPALDAYGIVAPQDLPQVVIPEAPAALDGWRFA
ncbi:MAG: hypothetical protein FJZ38_26410 [Candidatus Rokubacteria bacterium]|nr:hypothetical protein [Candidatus Rokubacteria bacterium]